MFKKSTGETSPPVGFEHWKSKTAWFLSGQAISLFGSSLTQYAIIWYITLTTSSGIMIMISSLCGFLPQILISLFAGVWADRHNRKALIIIADGLIALTTLIMAIIFMSGYRELWVLFLVSGIRSVGAGIQQPAVNAVIPQLVPPAKLMRMNGINGTIMSLTLLASPAVSGVVLSIFGLEVSFFIDVVTAIIAIVILSRIAIPRIVKSASEAASTAIEDLKAGIKYTWGHKPLRIFLLIYGVIMFFITPSAFLSPLFVTRAFGEDVWRLTVVEMAWSLGTAAGGLAFSAWGGFKNRVHTLSLGILIFGAFTMLMGFSGFFTMFLILLFMSGLSMPLMNSCSMGMLQETVEPTMQGRVFSLVQILGTAAMPLGMAIFGPIADFVDIKYLFILSGLIIAIIAVFTYKNKTLASGFKAK